MQAHFIDAYLFGPEAGLASGATALRCSLRRKCRLSAGDVISEVYSSPGGQAWRLPPHRCVSLVFDANDSAANGLGSFLQGLGSCVAGTPQVAVFVSAPWDENPAVRVDAVASGQVFTHVFRAAVLVRHLRAATGHRKATMDYFMESDMMGPGTLDLLSRVPAFRALFAPAIALEEAVFLQGAVPAASCQPARPRM